MPQQSKLFKGLAVLIGLALISLVVLKINSNMKKPDMPDMPPPRVTVAEPIEKTVSRYYEFTGTTTAIQSVEIRARVAGYLQSIEFVGNTDVNKGDLLFAIEPQSYKAKLDRASANLESSEAELFRAQKDLDRMQEAVKSDSVSKQQVSTVMSQRDKAKAAVLASKASLEEAKLEFSYTSIHSPINGRISRHLVDAGNLIGASENTLLASIVDIDPIHVYFKVNERMLLKKLKDRVTEGEVKTDVDFHIGLADESGYPHKGKIDYVDNKVDPETGTIDVRGVVPNKDKIILPGMFVRVSVPDGINNNALLVKEKALRTDFNGKYLLVVGDNNIVEQRPVVTGELVDDMRVIRQGLKKAERYIVNGLQFAQPGMPVTPMSNKVALK